jgi:hypothetical protein
MLDTRLAVVCDTKGIAVAVVSTDPHEDLNVFGLFPFAAEPALKVVEQYLASVKKYPNPPAPNATQFHSATVP